MVLSDTDSKAGIVTIYTGSGKTAGLQADAVNTISALDSGKLETVPGVDLTGKKAAGGTVALGIIPDDVHDVKVSLYVSGLPAGAVPYILFYNNMTLQWTLLPAVIDPATGLVVFNLPEDGTAVVVF